MEIKSRIKVNEGITWKGYNLSGLIGIVLDTTSYIRCYFPDLNLEVNLLSYEVKDYEKDSEGLLDMWGNSKWH